MISLRGKRKKKYKRNLGMSRDVHQNSTVTRNIGTITVIELANMKVEVRVKGV